MWAPGQLGGAGGAEHVLTVADFAGAQRQGVRFSRGDTGRAAYALAQAAKSAASGKFTIPVGGVFALEDVGRAHQAGESGQVRGKLVLLASNA